MSFHLPGNSSLKGKRAIVRKMVERSRSRFNASVAEVDGNDEHRRAVLGITVVGNSAAHVDGMLAKVVSFIEGLGVAVPHGRQTEVIAMGDEFGEDEFSAFLDGDAQDFEDFK